MPTSRSVAFIESAPARGSSFRPGAATTLSRRGSRVAHAARRDSQSYRRDRAGLSTQGATERRRRILTRAIPLVVLASTAFAVGAVVAAEPVAPAAQRLLDAWERDDYAAMHAELTPEAREEYPLKRFKRIYTNAAEAATTDVITVDEVREGDDTALAPVSIATAFGNLRGELALPIADGQVAWTPNLVYPGLAGGAAQSPHARAGPDSGRRSNPARRGPGRRAHARRRRRRRGRRDRDPDPCPGPRARVAGLPAGLADGHVGARARLERTPLGPARRSARRGLDGGGE